MERDTFKGMRFLHKKVATGEKSVTKRIMLYFSKLVTPGMVRLYLQINYGTIIYLCILLIGALSVSFVFTLPPPIRPRTSVGIMNVVAALAFVICLFVKGRRAAFFSFQRWGLLQYGAIGYLLAVSASMIVATRLDDFTPFRLLIVGIVVLFLIPEIRPSEQKKRIFIHTFAFLSFVFALLSILQAVFPNVMNSVADRLLPGRYAYGISIEFNRGRLLHWGALTFIFPFFYASMYLFGRNDRIWKTIYVFGGFVIHIGAIVMSNFRGEFMIFTLVTVFFLFISLRRGYISWRNIWYLVLLSVLTGIAALIYAKAVLGYSLLERFIFSNPYRDVTDTLGRITLFNQALTVFLSSPIVGVGYGNYFSAVWPFTTLQYFSVFDSTLAVPLSIASHNEFYTSLAETGVFGFMGLLLIIYVIGKTVFRAIVYSNHSTSTNNLLVLAVGASYSAIILYIWFENIYPQNIIYILLLGGVATHWLPSNMRSNDDVKK